jgi:hypothetical protein
MTSSILWIGACGRRAVSYEDRQDLLGHKSGRIKTHYTPAENSDLIEAANKVRVKETRTGYPAREYCG